MNAGHFEQISDCWSSEEQPATYYRTAAARARRLQADATTPRVKQYLDKMIAHCERIGGQSRARRLTRFRQADGQDENGEEIVIDSIGSLAELAEKKNGRRRSGVKAG